MQNVYLSEYVRVNSALVSGASLADLVAYEDAALDLEMQSKLATTMRAHGRIKTTIDVGFAYDQMLEQGNEAGEALVMGGVNGLIDQTRSIERVTAILGLDNVAFEGFDSIDNPSSVFE